MKQHVVRVAFYDPVLPVSEQELTKLNRLLEQGWKIKEVILGPTCGGIYYTIEKED